MARARKATLKASARSASAIPSSRVGKKAGQSAGKNATPVRNDDSFLDGVTTTADVKVPARTVDQVIGQERAVRVVKKASAQKRHVLLVGTPGTGKSMLAQSMAELLPVTQLHDMLVVQNPLDENSPNVKAVKAGEGRKLLEAQRLRSRMTGGNVNLLLVLLLVFSSFFLLTFGRPQLGDIITAALLIGLFVMGGVMAFGAAMGRMRSLTSDVDSMKLIVDNAGKKEAPFVDATGSRAGALLGDCRHDPLQSGGLGTPAHLRVEAGAVHRAHEGVLFIDEISMLRPKSQQELLTALQERKYSITGQSEMSSGALVKTAPVPCDFVLVAAGNFEDIRRMHPALRSRIRGYGYEVYMEDSVPDSPENRLKFVQFVAQEVVKDGKIPHFDRSAILEMVREALKRAGRKNRLTLRLRELGGLVRAAGDVAREKGAALVTAAHVLEAKRIARTAEQQMTEHAIEARRDYEVFQTSGGAVGKVNGLAVIGDSGIVLPLVAEVAPAASKQEGKIIATGKLGEIAQEAVENVSAIIKKHTGKDTTNYDIHIQFLQTYEGVEGDSASISVATAVISALEDAPIDQGIAMTGSLSVRGEVLPVGGVTQKVEAALAAGLTRVILPASNLQDLVLDERQRKAVTILPARDLHDVLRHALVDNKKKQELLSQIRKELA